MLVMFGVKLHVIAVQGSDWMMQRTSTAHSVNKQKYLCADVFLLLCLCAYEREREVHEKAKHICDLT